MGPVRGGVDLRQGRLCFKGHRVVMGDQGDRIKEPCLVSRLYRVIDDTLLRFFLLLLLLLFSLRLESMQVSLLCFLGF